VRTPGEGPYSFPGSLERIGGDFASSDGRIGFVVETNDSFLANLSFRIRGTRGFTVTESVGLVGFSVAPGQSQEPLSKGVGASDFLGKSFVPSIPSAVGSVSSNRRRITLAVRFQRQLGRLVGSNEPIRTIGFVAMLLVGGAGLLFLCCRDASE
jgi:hypothetical protein